jgi:hypothetical protein
MVVDLQQPMVEISLITNVLINFHMGVYHAFPSSAHNLDKAKPETCGDVFGLK